MKDAAKLAGYFAAVIITGGLLAPPLYWAGQWAALHLSLPRLAHYDFESYFHRSLLVAALIWLWPLFLLIRVRNRADLKLERNDRWLRDYFVGFGLAAIPLLCCAALLVATHWYNVRAYPRLSGIAPATIAALVVPFIEETFFRGLILGILLRSLSRWSAVIWSAALFAVLHFLKAPEQTSVVVAWFSGFVSISRAFAQFTNLPLLLGSFCTLFLLGCILADARICTKSLWLSIGLHAGWIFTAGVFNKFAHQKSIALPWLGQSLLVGLIPLATAAISWLALRWWLSYAQNSRRRTA